MGRPFALYGEGVQAFDFLLAARERGVAGALHWANYLAQFFLVYQQY
jgi:hypothetical protein